MLEQEARERQLSTLKQNTNTDSQIIDEREQNGEAAEHAAGMLQTNRQYVSDAKPNKT